ncbi:MAG: Gfo/Idh/MocA family oxidoreductase [Dysgonamonadaceae bacterium]|jgi:predicted dehydrogenase|nr:Gfo/Idh/MocA family oxidoreductase [Dysgonamonadaceae bacterium]
MKNEKLAEAGENISPDKPESTGRRDVLKSLVAAPVLGALAYGVYKKKKYDRMHRDISDVFKLDQTPTLLSTQAGSRTIRVGLIGHGIRGKQLMQALGFAEPAYIDELKEKERTRPNYTGYRDFMEQDDLNVKITAVCDIFDVYGESAILAGSNTNRTGSGEKPTGTPPKRYRNYRELLADENVDAVVIATPDHWHGQMTIDAAKAGKHVYCEKPLTWTLPETYRVRNVVKETGIVFQLGHQGRQTDSYIKAKEIVDKGLLGPISLVEMTTNRNDPNGAWVYKIIEGSNPVTIDWKQFEGPEQQIREYTEYMKKAGLERYVGPDDRGKFSLERFFRWRCWWDYSTGLSGDLLTHEYDAVNQIMRMGIPRSVTSSGGIYFFKDGRTVPDVLQTSMEFPDRNFTLLYSATLANQRNRGKVFMGHDASMQLSNMITVQADPSSDLYKEKIEKGIIPTDAPFYTYSPGKGDADGVATATELYFAQRGLMSSYINGKRYNTTYLHMQEWLECIRRGLTPSCNIDEAFDEAITAHMGTRAYLENKTMFWDKDKQAIVAG